MSKKEKPLAWKPFVTITALISVLIVWRVTGNPILLKLYPVAICLLFLFIFGGSLIFPPVIVFRFATLGDKSIKGSSFENKVYSYCKKVTIVWCVFFIFNAIMALALAIWSTNKFCLIYNGCISYIIMGSIFTVEFIVRKAVDKKMIKAFPITKFNADSRKNDYVMCFEGNWTSAKKSKALKTWKDFLTETAKLRAFLENEKNKGTKDWILHCEDYWLFLVTLVSLLQAKKRVLLTQNITENFIAEIKTDGVEFLTDQAEIVSKYRSDFFSIADLIENAAEPSDEEIRTTPEIVAEETEILMFTSGSTGKPKAVHQRMKEFEEDNAFIISKWAKEITSRKLITTVSQHHIYGFLFGICLPFTLGVPFRRKRVEFPEEFDTLTDEDYILIATPAFLKRTCDAMNPKSSEIGIGGGKLALKNLWIFTSGAAVSPELAVSTEKVFGFCPLEVYGSTETSGIAYRQQTKNGLIWTPFDNAKIWKGDDGCLRIISPYIKDPEGFATADLVEIRDDGKFLLKGRSDSIVKIEEKRISMTEVENRILETNLVKDVKVIAMTNDVRQFLAAAVVLNDEGKEKFRDTEKYLVNRFFHDFLMKYFENVVLPKKWRFVDALPVDVQGKKHKEEIEKLFVEDPSTTFGMTGEPTLGMTGKNE